MPHRHDFSVPVEWIEIPAHLRTERTPRHRGHPERILRELVRRRWRVTRLRCSGCPATDDVIHPQ